MLGLVCPLELHISCTAVCQCTDNVARDNDLSVFGLQAPAFILSWLTRPD